MQLDNFNVVCIHEIITFPCLLNFECLQMTYLLVLVLSIEFYFLMSFFYLAVFGSQIYIWFLFFMINYTSQLIIFILNLCLVIPISVSSLRVFLSVLLLGFGQLVLSLDLSGNSLIECHTVNENRRYNLKPWLMLSFTKECSLLFSRE